MKERDNTVIAVQKAIRYYGIPVSDTSISENLKSHPEYPSLKSICDVLNEWEITNYPVRMNKQELLETDSPFIAHLVDGGETLVFVEKISVDGRVKYFDDNNKAKSIESDEFFKQHSGVCVLLDPVEGAGEEDYSAKKQIISLERGLPYIAGLAALLFIVYSIQIYAASVVNNYLFLGLIITKLSGLILSIFLTIKDLDLGNNLVDKLCNFNKKANCSSLLNTTASKVFAWVHWSDMGLIYFSSGLLFLLGFPGLDGLKLLAIFSFLALAYVFYSIYYQAFVAKVWCPLCLGIQAVFIAEGLLTFNTLLPLQMSWSAFAPFAVIGFIISFVVVLYKDYFKTKIISQQQKIGYLKFKRIPSVFLNLLKKSTKIPFRMNQEVLVFGDKSASAEITAFFSLTCKPCQKAFTELKELLFLKDLRVNLVFSLKESDRFFMSNIAYYHDLNDSRKMLQLLEGWYEGSNEDRSSLLKKSLDKSDMKRFFDMRAGHSQIFHEADIAETPSIFANGRFLPKEYEVKDLGNFVTILKDDANN